MINLTSLVCVMLRGESTTKPSPFILCSSRLMGTRSFSTLGAGLSTLWCGLFLRPLLGHHVGNFVASVIEGGSACRISIHVCDGWMVRSRESTTSSFSARRVLHVVDGVVAL